MKLTCTSVPLLRFSVCKSIHIVKPVLQIAFTVLLIVFDLVQEMPVGVPVAAGPTLAAVTLAVVARFALPASRAWQPCSPLIGIGAGCVVTALFTGYDAQRVAEAPWLGFPLGGFAGFQLVPGASFWALLPMFVVVMLAGGIKKLGDNVAIQQASCR